MTKTLNYIKKQPQLVLLVAVIIAFCIVIPSFATERNIMNVLKNASISSFAAIGLSVVLIGGNLDLSIGSQFSCLSVFCLSMQRVDPVLGIIVPLLAAVAFGMLNGILVYKFKINSIVVTLGTMSILSGLALVPSNSMSVQGVPGTWFNAIAGTNIGSLSIYVIYFVILAVVIGLVLTKTKFGKGLYYMGINKEASEVAGQNVGKITVLSFIVCSLCVAVSAIVQGSRMMTANPLGGVGLEFEVLTALLIGGISLSGGRGNIVNTVVGVFLLALIVNAMNLLGAAYEYQLIARGALIIIAIIVDTVVRYKNGE